MEKDKIYLYCRDWGFYLYKYAITELTGEKISPFK
ncbi:hypothetical protein SLEP1_g24522 [Rubroshorea leprosula]|uniref:Uncharacterized protein n=1 Tax=Rubroshorea leprosula TaxID=152421 RepID=A0AAV5JQG9_9ROSI|nr:hypothetical protein SLEP1_g24522 [Rubroshorea leprosula]